MAPRTKLSEADRLEIRRLYCEGFSYKDLSEKFEVSTQTIRRICNPETYERQKEVNRQYQAKNQERINSQRKQRSQSYLLSFHTVNDEAVLMHLSKQENIHEYIRKLILNDIAISAKSEDL